MHHRRQRVAATATAVAAIATTVAAFAPAAQAVPKTTSRPAAAAGWLARALAGPHHDHYTESYSGTVYDDYGNTADGILAMDAAHTAQTAAKRATNWLAAHINGYAKDPTAYCGETTGYQPGSLAKSMLVAEAQHRNVHAFGGLNLAKTLVNEEANSGADKGLYTDPNTSCGYESPITQALALIALSHTATKPDSTAVHWLVHQMCADGGYLGSTRATSAKCKAGGEDTDTTGFAVQGLVAAGATGAAKHAAHWLLKHQKGSGGFGSAGLAANANSTAVAVQGLLATGHDRMAHAGQGYLLRNQEGCKAKVARRGSIDYQGKYVAGSTQLAATTQGAQAIAGGVLGLISNRRATASAPELRC